MFPPVLRMLAFYAGAAATLLLLTHRFVRPLRFTPIVFLLLAPLLFTGKAFLTAGVYAPIDIAYEAEPLRSHRAEAGVGPSQTPILSDVATQMIPWQKAVRDAVKNGRLPLWNPFVLAGEPLLAVQQHGALHPTSWIGFLLPLAQAWTLSMALRLFLAMVCAYLFLRELECGEFPSLFGAAAWAFSDYLIFFLGYPLDASVAPLPLFLLGLRRLARQASRQSAGVILIALLLMTTAGHPETLLHCVAGGGILFLFELAWADRGRRLRPLVLSLAAGALALGLSAVLFLPFREAVVRTIQYQMRTDWYAKSNRSVPLPRGLERSIKNVVPYAFGSWQHGGEDPSFIGPAAYAGSVLLPFLIVGVFARRRERWPLFVMGFLGLAAWARLPVINDAICRLPLFDISLNEYLVVLSVFAVVALAVFGLEWLSAGKARGLLLLGLGASLTLIVLLYLYVRPNLTRMGQADRRSLLAFQIVPLLLLGAVLLLPKGRRGAVAVPALALVLLLGQRRAEMGGFYPTVPSKAFYPLLPLFAKIPRELPFRFTAVGRSFVPSTAALYELEDVRGYEAMTFAPLVDTFPLWCVPQPIWFNRVDDPTKPFLSFLNVRYVYAYPCFSPPAGWPVLYRGRDGLLLENPSVLPRAFVPRRVYRESDPGRQRERLFAITDFGAEGVVEGPPGPLAENGEASVEIASYTAQRMEMSIDAREKSLIATSMTGWPGWRLAIDGREAPLLSYNRAFLAFEVPPGRHRAVLSYWPRSFTAGLWISGISLLATVAFFTFPRRHRPGVTTGSRSRDAAAFNRAS